MKNSTLMHEELFPQFQTIANTDLEQPANVQAAAESLERLVLTQSFTKQQEADLVETLDKNGLLEKLRNLYQTFEVNLETEFSNLVLGAPASLDYRTYPLYERFIKLVEHDVKLAQVKSEDRVAFIGSGPFPITAILLNELTGCEVHCYEKSRERVELSRKIISYLGLDSKICIFNVAGEELQNNGYSVVLVAISAHPKRAIIERIQKCCDKNVRIVCRTADGLRNVFYSPIKDDSLLAYSLCDRIAAGIDETVSSALLELRGVVSK
jgi:hypothetical protein